MIDSTQDADLRELLSDKELNDKILDIIKPHYKNSFGFARDAAEKSSTFQAIVDLIKSQKIAHADQVIGPDDPVQLASDAKGHIRYIQQVERNKLRSEQRERNKA